MSTESTTLSIPDNLPDPPTLMVERIGGLIRLLTGLTILCFAGLGITFLAVQGESEGMRRFMHSYLLGYVLALDIALGALFWVLVHHVTDAGWSVVLRRLYENITRMIPVLLVLFLPILLVSWVNYYGEESWLYKWASVKANSGHDHLWEAKQPFLSVPFFTGMMFIFFYVWLKYSEKMRNLSLEQDKTGDIALTREMQWWAPSGVALLALTATFTAFYLIMSLNFHWFSTIFGVYFWAGGIRGSLALCVLLVLALRATGHLRGSITSEHLHDMGKLMFGFTVFWTYIAFSQYFLIWYGNVPEETKFYLDRRQGSWYQMSILLPIFYFVIPFFLLLPRANKRNPLTIGLAAAWILFMHIYDLYWQIMPESLKASVGDDPSAGVSLSGTSILAVVGMLSLVGIVTFRGLAAHPIIPIRDPRLAESLKFENDEFGD